MGSTGVKGKIGSIVSWMDQSHIGTKNNPAESVQRELIRKQTPSCLPVDSSVLFAAAAFSGGVVYVAAGFSHKPPTHLAARHWPCFVHNGCRRIARALFPQPATRRFASSWAQLFLHLMPSRPRRLPNAS